MLSATLPGFGAGALKNREDAKALGTAKVCSSLKDIPKSGGFSVV